MVGNEILEGSVGHGKPMFIPRESLSLRQSQATGVFSDDSFSKKDRVPAIYRLHKRTVVFNFAYLVYFVV